jgi:hypothetical protein
MVFRILGRYTQ